MAVVMAACSAGCSFNIGQAALANAELSDPSDITGSIELLPKAASKADAKPTESDMALARRVAFDALTRGGKDVSLPWENPKTGARGSVTPLASAYAADGRTCRNFLASYVKGQAETWLEGEACKADGGRWEIRTMQPWKRS